MKLLFWLLLASQALAQINIPAEIEPYTVVEAKIVSSIPEGAAFNGGWEASEGVSWLPNGSGGIHLTAKPGAHRVDYVGFWVHVEEVTFLDGSDPPREITIQSYLGSGAIKETASFTVLGGTDPVPQPQPPAPGGKKSIVFFLDLASREQLPVAQRWLVTSLSARKKLEALGHEYLQIIDDDQLDNASATWKPWIDAVRGDPLPRVAFAPIDGGPIVDYPMPPDYNRLLQLLGEPNE